MLRCFFFLSYINVIIQFMLLASNNFKNTELLLATISSLFLAFALRRLISMENSINTLNQNIKDLEKKLPQEDFTDKKTGD